MVFLKNDRKSKSLSAKANAERAAKNEAHLEAQRQNGYAPPENHPPLPFIPETVASSPSAPGHPSPELENLPVDIPIWLQSIEIDQCPAQLPQQSTLPRPRYELHFQVYVPTGMMAVWASMPPPVYVKREGQVSRFRGFFKETFGGK